MKQQPCLSLLLVLLVFSTAWQRGARVTAHTPSHNNPHDRHNALTAINSAATKTVHDSRITLTVNTTKLTNGRGEWVEVSWQGVSGPSSLDWVGLLVPAGADPSTTTPAKYKAAADDVDGTHLTQGSGRLRFRLIGMRSPMQFLFFRGGLDAPVLAARSQTLEWANPNEPLQRRLSLTRDNTQVRVEWTTRDRGNPIVKWCSQPGQYTHTASATSSTYTVDELCGPPANATGWHEPGTFHSALLEGLEPGGLYHYVVGDEAFGFSPEASFRAAPAVGPDTRVKLVALADLGQAEEDGSLDLEEFPYELGPSLNTTGGIIAEMRSGAGYQLVMHLGDISYALGFATQWDNFLAQMEPIISTTPYMLTEGNHERDWPGSGDRFDGPTDSQGECDVPLKRRFTMPQPGPDQPYYSFDFGPIHFVVYSTEHDFAPGSSQHTFVLTDLATVDRTRTPWVVAGGHRPFYISSTNHMQGDGDQAVAADLRDAFEEAFVQYKVDLTLHGHHHSYQRSCPAVGGKCVGPEPTVTSLAGGGGSVDDSSSNSAGIRAGSSATYVDAPAPVHLVIGNAGAALSLNVEPRPADMWQTIRLGWGYLRIEADGSQLKCEEVSDRNGRVIDSLTLVKGEGWAERYMQARQEQQREQRSQAQQAQAERLWQQPGWWQRKWQRRWQLRTSEE